jgi:membrane associated rhomboid family serine protease
MPQSRQRHGHHYQKPADIPASQRVKGRIIWAILFAIFGLGIAFFASGTNWVALLIGALFGAVVGYFAGKSMEQDART